MNPMELKISDIKLLIISKDFWKYFKLKKDFS